MSCMNAACKFVQHIFMYIVIPAHIYVYSYSITSSVHVSCRVWTWHVCVYIHMERYVYMYIYNYTITSRACLIHVVYECGMYICIYTYGAKLQGQPTWLIHIWQDSFIRDTPLSYITHLIHTWHDSGAQNIMAPLKRKLAQLIHIWHVSLMRDMM